MDRRRGWWRRLRADGIEPAVHQRWCIAALVFVSAIVVTGAAVRLSGSGLGCTDWPNCNSERLLDVSSKHAAIEQINRLFTFVVGLAVVGAAAGSFLRRPRRADLTRLSLALVAGVPLQGLIGALVIWTDLHPAAVQLHMVASLILVALAVMLVVRSRQPDGPRALAVSTPARRAVRTVAALTALTLLAGTVTTGTGPHAGDEKAKRFFGTTTDIDGQALVWVTRTHATLVWVTVAAALWLAWTLRRRVDDRARLQGPLEAWLMVAAVQGAIGYVQYAAGLPVVLVGFHVLGATTLAGVTTWLVERTSEVARAAS